MTDVKDKLQNILSKLFPNPKVAIAVGIIAVLVVTALIAMPFLLHEEPAADTTYIVTLLTQSSELTTAKLHYTGMTEFVDAGVGFINKSDFVMVYEATARIGIDLEAVEVTADDVAKIIYVAIPAVTVQDVKIDASTIKYFDQAFSLFNFDQKEDSNEAIALAEEAAMEEVRDMGVLQMAQDQSATLIKGILANAIPDGYVIEIIQQ